MKKFLALLAALGLLLPGPLALNTALPSVAVAGPDDCSPLPTGYVRSGDGNCGRLLVVNADGSINVSGGGGGGGAVTIVDGGDVTQGAKADARATDSTSSWSEVALLKGIYNNTSGGGSTVTANQGTAGASAWLVTGTGGTFPVTGTFWQATQPVSGTVAATQSGSWLTGVKGADGSAIVSLTNGLYVLGTKANDGSGVVAGGTHLSMGGSDGTNYRIMLTDTSGRPVMVGAGTAGSASGGVLTIQGAGGGTAVPVSGTFWQATQPVSGTVTANIGTAGTLATAANQTGVQTTVGAGTAPTSANVSGLLFNSTAPAPTTGQSLALQGNLQGDLFTARPRDYLTTFTCSASCATTFWTSATAFPNGSLPYTELSLNFSANGSGLVVVVEGSNDNTAWNTLTGQASSSTTATLTQNPTTTSTTNTVYRVVTPYVRVRASSYTSGTVTGNLALRDMPQTIPVTSMVLSSGGNAIGSLTAGTAVIGQVNEAGNSFSHLAANATTTMKSGTGTLHACVVNTLGTADTVTLYDNTAGSGTVIAVINSAVSQATLTYDLTFATGLTAVVAGTTAPDVTCTWR